MHINGIGGILMPFIKKRAPMRRRPTFKGGLSARASKKRVLLIFLLMFFTIGALAGLASRFLKEVAGQMALSDAIDLVTATINSEINKRMSESQYDYDYFVTLQKDNEGNITAISANMSRINTLSSEILQEVIAATNSGMLDLNIPLGNLMGTNLMLGRGPKVPVRILMLTSSFADFRNDLSAAGINQIKHQIILEVRVEIDVLLPWDVMSTEVLSEVLIAETVLVGKVPDAYLNFGNP